jgi:GC-rich sequence DNA-binding factor
VSKGKRNIREEDAEDSEEEERVNMAGITGVKEREERREKFYSAQSDHSDVADSDVEINEWENQQIRKGVTGAQLMSAQQESAFYMLPSSNNSHKNDEIKPILTTAELLEQAYSQSNHEIAKYIRKEKKKEASTKSNGGIKTPQEILKKIREKLQTSRELNYKHFTDINRFSEEFKNIKIDLEESEKNGPQAANKYRYYQELKLYVEDLTECLNEKVPMINALEEKVLNVTSKYSKMLIERRRQDVRDQAKEITEIKTVKKTADDEERVRRAAEREGRRNRRRRNREKLNMNEAHNDGMSSDDEVPDNESSQYRESLAQIKSDASLIFDDVSEEYCDLAFILQKFDEWKKKDLNAYKEAYIHLCLPKIVTIFIRWKMISWNPFLSEYYEDIDKMDWYHDLAVYGRLVNESEESLRNDPDVFLIPSIIEKLILSKLNSKLK